ncbi:malonyl-[acyl-carrier protein] O-methyltransferase BioC [Thiocystis minor]|uniref:malonyl-ACP O-methyltransferase BioC n=1 Tax=Thiocystis minor TaxID=61597 RepID=UPI001913A083|nr:malonyl-ACP O-methyltransferase BioC [Thiocystis minor]MBK5964915.1 malonyl-[acyl-carrier protein] O-methyltransferase BioC [Thiocystis minor]
MIDKGRARRGFEHAATHYDTVAVLQRELADRLLERLDYVRLEPQRILDLGAGTGYAVGALHRRYRRARVMALDFAHGMLLQARKRGGWLRRPWCVCADAEALPLADGAVDLIVSNATLQWCDLERAFGECLRVLRPGGLFLFTTFGPDTLKELRLAWSEVDGDSHVSPFLDMHDIGDALVRTRFADPVMDVERLTLTYAHARDLMRDLKLLGAHNATHERPRALTGRARLAAVERAYERHRDAGRLPASYEVVYGHAWAPEQKPGAGGIAIPLSAIGGRKRSGGQA